MFCYMDMVKKARRKNEKDENGNTWKKKEMDTIHLLQPHDKESATIHTLQQARCYINVPGHTRNGIATTQDRIQHTHYNRHAATSMFRVIPGTA